jgi:hypothetical protein
MRLPAAYSGFLARHFACVFFRRAAWHSGLLQACCRDLTRGSGWNQWRQMEHGLFRGAGIVNHHRHAGTSISAFRSSRLGQFWRAEVGNSWRAPKDQGDHRSLLQNSGRKESRAEAVGPLVGNRSAGAGNRIGIICLGMGLDHGKILSPNKNRRANPTCSLTRASS